MLKVIDCRSLAFPQSTPFSMSRLPNLYFNSSPVSNVSSSLPATPPSAPKTVPRRRTRSTFISHAHSRSDEVENERPASPPSFDQLAYEEDPILLQKAAQQFTAKGGLEEFLLASKATTTEPRNRRRVHSDASRLLRGGSIDEEDDLREYPSPSLRSCIYLPILSLRIQSRPSRLPARPRSPRRLRGRFSPRSSSHPLPRHASFPSSPLPRRHLPRRDLVFAPSVRSRLSQRRKMKATPRLRQRLRWQRLLSGLAHSLASTTSRVSRDSHLLSGRRHRAGLTCSSVRSRSPSRCRSPWRLGWPASAVRTRLRRRASGSDLATVSSASDGALSAVLYRCTP